MAVEQTKDDAKKPASSESVRPATEQRESELKPEELDNATGGCASGQHIPLT